MAACAVDLFGEKKEDEFTDIHSLANVVAFSTKRKQMSETSREGLIVSDSDNKVVDRRTKIVFKDSKFQHVSYYMLCQLTAKVLDGKKGLGSCTAVSGAMGGERHFLTCAHNLVECSIRSGDILPYTDIFIYKARQGEKNMMVIFQGNNKKYRVHPKYDGQPDCGFDIGIIPVLKGSEVKRTTRKVSVTKISDGWDDVKWSSSLPGNIKKGMAVELAGFPGEKEGWPYTHKGTVQGVTKTKLGGYLIWYDCDATPGNSGSCVMITDKDFVKSCRCNKIIVGVHTGHCPVEKMNYGTLITPAIHKWIKKGKSIKTGIPNHRILFSAFSVMLNK